MTMDQLYKQFSLDENAIDFLGHAVALYTNDDYRMKPCMETLVKMQLYGDSMGKYG